MQSVRMALLLLGKHPLPARKPAVDVEDPTRDDDPRPPRHASHSPQLNFGRSHHNVNSDGPGT